MIKVLVVDAQAVVRRGIECILEKEADFALLGEASGVEGALKILEKSPDIDLVLLDIEVRGSNGFAAIRELRSEYPRIKILVFTSQPEELYAINSIKTGAVGYLDKKASVQEVVAAIRMVNQGNIYLSRELDEKLSYLREGRRNSKSHKKLSSREIEVLKMLSEGKRNKDVADALDINEKTVSTYKARLLKKIGVNNMVELINHAQNLEIYR